MPADAPLYACLPPRGADADAMLNGFLKYVEQLGLTLDPSRASIEALIIDSAELPTPD